MPDSSSEIWGMILMRQNKALDPALCGSLNQGWPLKFKFFFYMKHLNGYDNIFETEAW